MAQYDTQQEYKAVLTECRALFTKKLYDYGASWRIMRPSSLTDQLFIKAKRIRSIETTGKALVNEGIRPEFVGLVNYGIIGLIQLEKGFADKVDMTNEEATALYDKYARSNYELMACKNHDYGEAWREMRISSFTDIILTKLARIKELEDHHGQAMVSEGIDANYADIVNYAVFALIRMNEADKNQQTDKQAE